MPRLNTLSWQTVVFSAKKVTIKGEEVLCTEVNGTARNFALKDLVWMNDEAKDFKRVCYRRHVVNSGVRIDKKPKPSSKYPGFSEVKLPNGVTMLLNRRMHQFIPETGEK